MNRINQLLTKVCLLLTLVVFSFGVGYSATYYISNSGNDSNTGLTTAQAWKTLAKVNRTKLLPGDSILLHCGDLWREQMTINNSGTKGQPIVISKYGEGEDPQILGSETIKSWINIGGNIWKSTNATERPWYLSTGNVFFLNIDNTIGTGSVKDGIINLKSDYDWFWQLGYVYIYSRINPSLKYGSVEISQRMAGIYLSKKDYIEINGIDMFFTVSNGVHGGQTSPTTVQNGLVIRNCEIAYNGYPDGGGYGISVIGNHMFIENNIIHDCGRRGISIYLYSNFNVKDITIQENNFYNGYHTTGIDIGIVDGYSGSIDSILIRNNIIEQTPDYNPVSTPMLMHIANDGNGTLNNLFIFSNIIKYPFTPGIYFRHIQGAKVYNNTFYGHNETNTDLGSAFLFFSNENSNIKIKNNIFYSQLNYDINNAGITYYLTSTQDPKEIESDYNIFYRINSKFKIIRFDSGGINLASTDSLKIRKEYGWEIHSKFIDPKIRSLSNMSLEGNSIAFTGGYNTQLKDLNGNNMEYIGANGSRNAIFYSEYIAICQGKSYNGWTLQGKYERNLKTISARDSIVTTFLTIIPVSKVTENITINDGENYNGWKQTGTYTRKLTAVNGCDSLVTTNLVVVKLINKQGEVLPTHYSPSGLNQTGQNPMVLRIEGAQLEDLPLGTGDEIAVFSGSSCVGAIRLSQAIQSGDPASYATLSVYPRTSTTEGFVANDTIVFKLWSAQLQKEMPINRVTYKNTLDSWMTSGKFSSGSASVVELFSYTELTQTINLKEGYNLISAYVLPTNADAGTVLKSLSLSGSLTKVQDESGRAYENWGTAGGWVNSIGLMEETEGYKVRVTADCTLKITGRPVALPLDIPLVEGWNLISYPRMDEVNAMSVIQSLIDENKLIKVQDENGSAIENWQSFGGWVNGIGNFVPGKAYKVKVSASTVLHINDTYLKSGVLLAQSAQPEHFFSITEGNGTDHMNINLSGLKESGLQTGDEVGAFDGSVCVGSLKVTQGHLDNGLAVITASYKTDASVKDGFTEGNSVQLRIWKQQTGAEVSANLICNAGRLVYERNASVFVQLKSVALTTSVKPLSNSSEVMVYPNPSDGAFTVKFDQMSEEGSRIDILDLSGKKITSRLVSGYAEDFNLAGQAPGVYLVKSTQGSKEVVRKLIIN